MKKIDRLINFLRKTYKISADNLLLGGVVHLKSENVGDRIDLRSEPLYLVMHYTATHDAASAIKILCDRTKEVSAHLVIDRSGKVFQLVPFDRVAWHVGVSEWKGIKNRNLNQCSIGIELVNSGKLSKKDDGYYSWDEKKVNDEEVFIKKEDNGEFSFWQNFSTPQIAKLKEIVACLRSNYKVSEILTHEQIAPGRKIDPGPAFPIEEFKI